MNSPAKEKVAPTFLLLRLIRGAIGLFALSHLIGFLLVITGLRDLAAVPDEVWAMLALKMVVMVILVFIFSFMRSLLNQMHTKRYGVPHPALKKAWAL